MKRRVLWSMLFLIVACQAKNKSDENKIKINFTKEVKQEMRKETQVSKYINLEQFNNKYSYWDSNNTILTKSLINTKNEELDKYMHYKEKDLKKYESSRELDEFKFMTQEEKVIQMMKLLVEIRKVEVPLLLESNEYVNNNYSTIFGSYIENYIRKLYPNKKYFYEILEKNFNIEDIEIILKYLTYNSEFENYEVEGRYNLKKVDAVLDNLSKVEGISEEEWLEREGTPYVPVFKNEIDSLLGFIYLLKDNKVLITDGNGKKLKEIKVKDYKNTDMAIYKGKFYIYDDGKIFEYSGKNFENVEVVESRNVNFE